MIGFFNDHFGAVMYSSFNNVCYSSYNSEQNFDFLASDFLLFLPLLLLLGVGEWTSEFSFSNILTCFSTFVTSILESIDSFLSETLSSSSDSSSSSLVFAPSSLSLSFELTNILVND